MVICDDEVLRNLVAEELETYGLPDVAFAAHLPERPDPSVANFILLGAEFKLPFGHILPPEDVERFRLMEFDHQGARYWVASSSSLRGRYYGFLRFLEGNDRIEEQPGFGLRGVVEGFYGPPWAWEDREDMVRFISDLRMNLYIYAPKDDPLHRERWREDYDEETMGHFEEIASLASSKLVDFCYALSPGLSIDYGSEADVDAVVKKLRSLHDVGVRAFALFLDDIPDELQSEADRKAFSSLGEAQRHFLMSLRKRLMDLDPGIRLIFCPTRYHGIKATEYHGEIAKLPEDIAVFWTGPQICSKTIRSEDAKAMCEAFGRKVLIWDNYPVNDYDRKRLHMNAVRNRDTGLPSYVSGILTNPMSEAEASKIAILSYGDYLWDPKGYDPDESLERALTFLFGIDVLPLARTFVSSLADLFFEADDIRWRWAERALEGDDLDIERALARYGEMSKVRDLLCLVENEKLVEEIRLHVEKVADIGDLGQLYLQREMRGRKVARNTSKVFSDRVVRRMLN
jgi:hyaluronoglucosaminidase